MPNKIITAFLCILFSATKLAVAQPESYKGIPAEYYKTVLIDNFDEKENFFSTGTPGQSAGKVENGTYTWSSLTNQAMFSFFEISGYSTKDFEFETTIKNTKGKNNAFNGLIIGNGQDEFYYFGFTAKGEFAVLEYHDSVQSLKPFTDTDIVNKKGYNKITVRKIANVIYYFLNEQLMYEIEVKQFVPARFGYLVAENSSIESEYIRYSEIEKSFYTVERLWNTLKLNGIKPENKIPVNFNFAALLPESLKPSANGNSNTSLVFSKSNSYSVKAPTIDSAANYEIELQINRLDSNTTEFSFFWSSSDSLYNQVILLPLAGVARINSGVKTSISKTSLIQCTLKPEAETTILIRKVNNAMYFFVNFELLSIQKALPIYGNNIGFFTQNKAEFELNLLQINRLITPEIYLRKR